METGTGPQEVVKGGQSAGQIQLNAVVSGTSSPTSNTIIQQHQAGDCAKSQLYIAKVDPKLQAGSNRCGCLYQTTKIQPTNYDMLIFRVLNRLLRMPSHNEDHMAQRMLDELMPMRSWWLRNVPWAKYQLKNGLENARFGVPGCINFIDARTKWFDAAVSSALAGGIKQVVLIAAGYDTRAYRFASPGVAFFEVDLPSASQRKALLVDKLQLVPTGASGPTYVAADLSVKDLGEALSNTGFDPSKPTLFTLEGLIYYLPPEAAQALLARINQLAAVGSKVVFDFMHAAALEGRPVSDNGFKYGGFTVTAKAVANKGEPYRFGLPDSAAGVSAFLEAASSMNASTAGGSLQLRQYMGPKEMIATQLPHVKWNDKVPPIAAFYSYAAAEKVAA